MRIAEADWKVFKVVRAEALDRFCRTVLHECRAISDDESRTAHERYLDLYRYVQERDREMAHAFDDFRRSTAVLRLMQFHQLGLLTEEEIARFSEDVQRGIRRDP